MQTQKTDPCRQRVDKWVALNILKGTNTRKRMALRVIAGMMKVEKDYAKIILDELRKSHFVVKSGRRYYFEGEPKYYITKLGKEAISETKT